MTVRSKRFFLAILVGMIVGLLFTIFVTPTCWGLILGVFATANLANASSPRDGALVGWVVSIPVGIYATILAAIQMRALENLGSLVLIPFFLLAIVLISGLGALYGLIIGKLFQITKGKKLML